MIVNNHSTQVAKQSLGDILGSISKFWVAAGGSSMTALVTLYPHARWLPIVSGAITALLVYLVPNGPVSVPTSNTNTVPQETLPKEGSQS
jgi:hypothetical protein